MVLNTLAQDRISLRTSCIIYVSSIVIFNVAFFNVAFTSSPVADLIIGTIFGAMVAEDILNRTIDIRLVIALFSAIAGFAVNQSSSLVNSLICIASWFFLSLLFFRILFLLLIKDTTAENNTIYSYSNDLFDDDISKGSAPALPAFAVSVILTMGFLYHNWLPLSMSDYIFKIVVAVDYYNYAMLAVMVVAWVALELRYRHLRRSHRILKYGFGDGDILVLAAWGIYLSFGGVVFMFTVSLVFQLLTYLIFWVINRGRMIWD